MAAYLTFTDRKSSETSSMQEIDQALCNHFGAVLLPTTWYRNWYNTVGVLMAIGLRGEELHNQIRSGVRDPEMAYALVEVAEFIEEHYEPKSWLLPDSVSLN